MSDLLIERKIEHLLNKEIYTLLKNFPHSETHALCKDVKRAFNALAVNVIQANSSKYKRREYQDKADGWQKTLLFYVNTAHSQRYISNKQKLRLQAKLEEIGRMLGGWMKNK